MKLRQWPMLGLLLFCLFTGGSVNWQQVSLAAPTTLHVIRTGSMPQNFPSPLYPSLDRLITNPEVVQQLYRAVYALPSAPSGPVFCLADLGITDSLLFLQGTRLIAQMQLDETGCLLLQVDGKNVRRTTDAFRQLFFQEIETS
jgi:hypothetical protein